MKMNGENKRKDKEEITGRLHGRQGSEWRGRNEEKADPLSCLHKWPTVWRLACESLCDRCVCSTCTCLFSLLGGLRASVCSRCVCSSGHSFQLVVLGLYILLFPLFHLSVTSSCAGSCVRRRDGNRDADWPPCLPHLFVTEHDRTSLSGRNTYQARVTSRPEQCTITFKIWNVLLLQHELYLMAVFFVWLNIKQWQESRVCLSIYQ